MAPKKFCKIFWGYSKNTVKFEMVLNFHWNAENNEIYTNTE